MSEHGEIGRMECLSFFPPGYKNSSETGETTPVPTELPKKKKKKRKARDEADAEVNTEGEVKLSEEVINENEAGDEKTEDDDGIDNEEDEDDIDNEATDEHSADRTSLEK